jgi:hypothetical protein
MRLVSASNHVEVGADMGRKIDLVVHEQVGAGDARSAFARQLLAGAHVDHVDRQVGELGREGGGRRATGMSGD